MTDAVFIPDGDQFVPTAAAGSPWADDTLHGGPPAGLLARAIERHAGAPDMHVSRLTIDLFRPVSKAPLEVTTRTVRAGRRIHVVEAALLAGGVEMCRASGLLLRRTDAPVTEGGTSDAPPGPEGFETESLAGRRASSGPRREGFHTTIEVRWVTRPHEPGLTTAWIRIPVPLVAGEATSPLVRIAATADFVNPLAGLGASGPTGFINADCTIYLHRLPVGEWICIQAERAVEPFGVGVASAVLFDQEGPVGRAAQAALANALR